MTKPTKQTSSAVSSIAGKYARMNNRQMLGIVRGFGDWEVSYEAVPSNAAKFFRDIRKLAASYKSVARKAAISK